MSSKRAIEGYLLIDHRDSPGFTPEEARAAHWGKTMPVGSKKFQYASYKCCGCGNMIVKGPAWDESRHYCAKCDAYSCDNCNLVKKLTGEHIPMVQVADQFMDAALKGHDTKPITDAFMQRRQEGLRRNG